mmetsp:Transcript_24967/g.31155  ORF Transcript_24967/g.31155 Transcript_24967/m.31155 type:complete len:90 (+) Transcript_24967:774-1043(+)
MMMKWREVRTKFDDEKRQLEREHAAPVVVKAGQEQKAIESKRDEIANLFKALQNEKKKKEDLYLRTKAFEMIRERFNRDISGSSAADKK